MQIKVNKKSLLPKLILLVIMIGIPVLIIMNSKHRNKIMKYESYQNVAVIEHLRENVSAGKKRRKDVIYFYFIQNDTIVHKIFSTGKGEISSRNIQVGEKYELKVGKNETGIFKLNLDRKIDTVLIMDKSLPEKFNSLRHRQIIVEKNN